MNQKPSTWRRGRGCEAGGSPSVLHVPIDDDGRLISRITRGAGCACHNSARSAATVVDGGQWTISFNGSGANVYIREAVGIPSVSTVKVDAA